MARATPSARFLETEPRRWKNETLMDRLRPQKKPYPLSRSDLNALRAYTATVPMTQYDVPEVSRRFRPHLPLHFALQISEK